MMRIALLVLAAALVVFVAVGELTANAGETDVTFEAEPNDASPEVLDMGPGAQPGQPVSFRIKGWIDPAEDVDRFALALEAGDVVGVTVTDTSGLDPQLELVDAAGDLVIAADDVPRGNFPAESPLPNAKGPVAGGNAGLYVVVPAADIYVLTVAGEDGTTGRYRLDIVVARPGLEAYPKGTKQIVFVDFDGAKVNMGEYFFIGGSGKRNLSPMRDFLGAWGLTAADEDAVIDAVLATLEENLAADMRERGLNGDYASSGIPGEFDLEIRNSRDDPDTYGLDPLVTRLVIGGTQAEGGVTAFAANSVLDPGNFGTADDTIILLDQLTGLTPGPRDLNAFGIAAGHTKVELIGRALGNIGAHELGHVFGCLHTERYSEVLCLMDQGTPYGFDAPGAGPDRILGTADDVDRDFEVDAYASTNYVLGGAEPFRGPLDTLNTIAFGLATGRR